jgi:histidinol-phosphate aminotransferase
MNTSIKSDYPKEFQPVENIAKLSLYSVPQLLTPIDLYLDGNEGTPPDITDIFPDLLLNESLLNRYPSAAELEKTIAAKLGIDAGQVMVTAGGDEAIDRACRIALDENRNAVIPSPAFCMYEHYALLAGSAIKKVEWNEPDFPIENYINAIDENIGLIVIASPNNPTGYVIDPDYISRLAKVAPYALIVLDLAYEEFADIKLTSLALNYPNCLVLRTFSKAWGLAGLRIGYAIGSNKVISWLRKAGGPYSVSSLSINIAKAVMKGDDSTMLKYVEDVKQSRKHIYDCLKQLGAEPVLSQANFVFARFKNADWVRRGLAGLGIKVRAFPDTPDLANALRITCPPEKHRDRLIHALQTVMKPEAILFDLDGVLADVSESYHQTIIRVGESYGIHISTDQIVEMKAGGNANNDWELTQLILNRAGLNPPLPEIIERFEAIYQGNAYEPGLWEKEKLLISKHFFNQLRSHVALSIVTGRPKQDVYRFLTRFDLLDIFYTVICMDDAPPKPSPEPVKKALANLGVKRAWMIGDNPDDIQAARGADVLPLGIAAPGVDNGIMSTALLKAGAAKILNSIEELKELLK